MLKSESVGALNKKGEAYYNKGILDSALVCFSIVSGSYVPETAASDAELYAHAYNRCGVIYIRYNSYTKALNMLLKGLEICETIGNEKYMSRIYNNIGNVYYVFRDYNTARSYCEKAYSISLKYKDETIQQTLLNNLIGLSCYLQEYSNASKYLEQLKKLNHYEKSFFNYYFSLSSGAIQLEQGKYEDALRWFKKALFCADSCMPSFRLRYVAFSNISKTFEYSQQYDSALVYLHKAEKIAMEEQNQDLRYECYNGFSEIYRKMGNEKEMLNYKKKHLEIADSIFSTQTFGQIKDMQFLHEMDKIEKQVYRLKDAELLKDNQIRSQQRILYVFIGGFVIIISLLVLMYLQNKKLRDANKELFNKNLEIIRSEESQKQKRQMQAPVSVVAPLCDKREKDLGDEAEDMALNKKYQTSAVSQEEKLRIRQEIQNVMDNTLEYCSDDFNLEKLAVLVGSKSKYVSQVINESYGKNFNTYINEYRIREARKRLIDTHTYGNYTIASIAAGVGFKSNGNFNLIFKKVTGITPSVYQSMAKKRMQKQDDYFLDV